MYWLMALADNVRKVTSDLTQIVSTAIAICHQLVIQDKSILQTVDHATHVQVSQDHKTSKHLALPITVIRIRLSIEMVLALLVHKVQDQIQEIENV
jgi:hypothetical protein